MSPVTMTPSVGEQLPYRAHVRFEKVNQLPGPCACTQQILSFGYPLTGRVLLEEKCVLFT